MPERRASTATAPAVLAGWAFRLLRALDHRGPELALFLERCPDGARGAAEDHRGAIVGVVAAPVADALVLRVAVAGEGDPGVHHLEGEPLGIGSAAAHAVVAGTAEGAE